MWITIFEKTVRKQEKNHAKLQAPRSNIIELQRPVSVPQDGPKKGKCHPEGSPGLPQRVPGPSRDHPWPAQQGPSQIYITRPWGSEGHLLRQGAQEAFKNSQRRPPIPPKAPPRGPRWPPRPSQRRPQRPPRGPKRPQKHHQNNITSQNIKNPKK